MSRMSAPRPRSSAAPWCARGADLLIHEVVSPESFQRAGIRPERAKSVIAHHVTPEEAGDVEVGEDRMVILVGEKVEVRRPAG